MTTPRPPQKQAWSLPWVAAVAAAALAVAAFAEHSALSHVWRWWGWPPLALFGAFVAALVTVAGGRPVHVVAIRAGAWLAGGAWLTWASLADLSQVVWLTLAGGTAVFAGLHHWSRPPGAVAFTNPGELVLPADLSDRRPGPVREWETLIRHITGKPVVVTAVTPWARPADGEQVHLDLPLGMSWRGLDVAVCENLQAARRLPPGCVIRALEGLHQGSAVLDVMLRDCLADRVTAPVDYTEASINNDFTLMFTPRGESLPMCLRQQSMVVGGAPGSGKTTLLHRLILWLARCSDTLIWVVDPNGGGLAEPWIGLWARGEATAPVVDWVADDEAEAAVMVAVAAAIAKDRKTSKEAVQRKRAGNTTVLPVDRDLPAIVVIGDEGGELRQKANLLGQLAVAGLSRLAQIGRAEAVRAVMSVLRGTADLLDKGLRVNAALRICLRMEEEDEYSHVLGAYPGRTRLVNVGSGYVRRPGDLSPVFARSADLDRAGIERAAVATAHLRPRLDDRAKLVASRVRVVDVLDGKEPWEELLALPVMGDVQSGRAYEGRWQRYARKLAEMRGEDLPDEPKPEPVPAAASTTKASAGGPALAAFSASVGVTAPAAPRPVDLSDAGSVDREAERLIAQVDWVSPPVVRSAPKLTAREHIRAILRDAYPKALTSAEIGERLKDLRGEPVNRTYRQDLLDKMLQAGEVVQPDGKTGPYTVPAPR